MNSHSPSSIYRLQQYVKSHLVESITVTITSSLLLTGVSTWNIWKVYQGFQTTITKQFALQQHSEEIRYYDEVLTMSAQMLAQTGEAKWEKRYNESVPKLEASIKSALDGSNAEIRKDASSTDAANQALVKLEEEAFALVKKGDLKGAQGVLFGKEYETQKSLYKQGNDLVLQKIGKLVQSEITGYRQGLWISIGFALAILPILVGGWLLILAAVRSYIEERQSALAKLEDSQNEALQINEQLQVTAKRRQQEQQAVQQESQQLQEDIGDLLDAVAAMEDGDLTTTAPVNDRLTGLVGDTLNRLAEELGRVMKQFSIAAEQVSINSSQQKAIASQVVASTGDQSKSIGSVMYLTHSVRNSAKTAVQQLTETNKSLLTLQNTVVASQNSVQTLDQESVVLQDGSERIVQQIKTLGEFVGLADRFVQDQSEISIQTQILALNASLVAARAAEQRDPQKFAAVAREFESIADQVSQLAQKTNDGLTELEQRSSQISTVVTTVDGEVQQLGELVKSFIAGVRGASDTFATVQEVTQQVVTAGEVVTQTNQQILKSTGLTVTTMDSLLELSGKMAVEAQASQQMGDQMGELSHNLLQSIRVFKLPNGSETSEVPPTLATKS
jgi:methyl-accepting chemotaxis protein PixJ